MEYWSPQGGSSPVVTEGSGDSEPWSDAGVVVPRCHDDGGGGDDDDAESCNHDVGDLPHCGREPCDDGGGSDEDSGDSPPRSWGAWLAEITTGCKCQEEEPIQGDDVEAATEKPAAGVEDRLFWEACLEHGYP